MTTAIRFDDSLPAFASLVNKTWGGSALEENLFLRDVSGRLTFVLVTNSKTHAERSELATQAQDELGAYVDNAGFAVATPQELFDDTLTTLAAALRLPIHHDLFEGFVYVVDRRIVGADWLRTPEPGAGAPARFVFASLKGGLADPLRSASSLHTLQAKDVASSQSIWISRRLD